MMAVIYSLISDIGNLFPLFSWLACVEVYQFYLFFFPLSEKQVLAKLIFLYYFPFSKSLIYIPILLGIGLNSSISSSFLESELWL